MHLTRASIARFVLALPDKLREEDKIQHFVWSFWLTVAGLFFCSGLLALSAVFLIGLAKECWDFRYGSGFCLFDMVGNMLGILAALLCGFIATTILL